MARPISICLAIAMGIYILFYLNEANAPLKKYFRRLTDLCFTDLYKHSPERHEFFFFHVPGVDHFNCLTTPVYGHALRTPDGLFVLRQLLALFLSVLGLFAVESLRPLSSGFVANYPVVSGLSQVLGISVMFPWAWLASYWWVNQSKVLTPPAPFNSRTNPQASHREPYPGRVLLATLSLILMALIMVAMCIPSEEDATINMLIATFNPIVPMLAALHFLLPAAHSSAGRGHRYAIVLHYIVAAICYAFHVWSVYPIIMKPGFPTLEEFIPVMTGRTIEPSPSHFLFIDLAALTLQCMWFIALEPLEGAVLPYLVLSVLAGPGTALSLFLVRREKYLSTRQKQH